MCINYSQKWATECGTIKRVVVSVVVSNHHDNVNAKCCHLFNLKRHLAHIHYTLSVYLQEMGHNIDECMKKGIANSKVVVLCVNKKYQQRRNCMYELEEAKAKESIIVTIVTDADPLSWAEDRVKEVCNFETNSYCDLSELGGLEWDAEDGPSDATLDDLTLKVGALKNLLEQHDCIPTLNEASMKQSCNETSVDNFDSPLSPDSRKLKGKSLFELSTLMRLFRKTTPTSVDNREPSPRSLPSPSSVQS